mmetsp:Transcript_126490/g.366181  ORF Transcript_126490/g.366181 Transcript_126490/m.366181 type:complete len:252 (-) Transcript_126490:1027-1782(-)
MYFPLGSETRCEVGCPTHRGAAPGCCIAAFRLRFAGGGLDHDGVGCATCRGTAARCLSHCGRRGGFKQARFEALGNHLNLIDLQLREFHDLLPDFGELLKLDIEHRPLAERHRSARECLNFADARCVAESALTSPTDSTGTPRPRKAPRWSGRVAYMHGRERLVQAGAHLHRIVLDEDEQCVRLATLHHVQLLHELFVVHIAGAISVQHVEHNIEITLVNIHQLHRARKLWMLLISLQQLIKSQRAAPINV